MAGYPIEVSGFTGARAALNGLRTIDVSKRRAMKFAATVGLPMLVASTGRSSQAVSLAAYKAIAIQCAMDFTGTSLRRPREYESMDPSEKGNISYWIGMMTAALVSNDVLDAPRMLHAAGFGPGRIGRTTPESKRLADLVGQQRDGSWHVVEAKARQGEPSDARREVWKSQALTIATVDGRVPATRSYALARISRRFRAELIDPPDDGIQRTSKKSQRIRQPIDSRRLQTHFYRPLRDWLGDDVRVVERGEVRVRVRVAAYDADAAEYVLIGLSEEAFDLANDQALPPLHAGIETEDAYIGGDGVVLILSARSQVR